MSRVHEAFPFELYIYIYIYIYMLVQMTEALAAVSATQHIAHSALEPDGYLSN